MGNLYVADLGLRDLSSVIPGARKRDAKREPVAPPLAQRNPPPVRATDPSVIVTPPPPPAAARQVLGGDTVGGPDALGFDPLIATLAELAAHRGTATPLCIGLFGGPGTGKSFALGRLTSRIRDLATAAANAQSTPFLSRVHVQKIDAATLDGDPAVGLAAQVYAGLRRAYTGAAREIAFKTRDPHIALRESNERLNEARRQLDIERRALDDAGSRRARLTESVLYEAAGSQVDAYVRANRASIESRLTSFGIIGDPVRNFKDLVQLVAGSGRVASLAVRSLWAYKGQMKLIVAAIVLVALGYGIGIVIDDQASWLGELQSGPKTGTSLAAWLQAHMGLFSAAKTGASLLTVVCILANLWRAFTFVQPISKGAKLLKNDLDSRRRDLDAHFGHQTKRVDTLEADVERLTLEAAEAERHAGSGAGAAALAGSSPFETSATTLSQDFFALLGVITADAKDRGTPQRIIIALDHLEAVTPERARAILGCLGRLAGPGILTIVGLDNGRLKSGVPDIERWVQIPVHLEAESRGCDYSGLVRSALGKDAPASARAALDPRCSVFDDPVSEEETALLSTLANLLGGSPRAVRRLASLYAVARLGVAEHRGILALLLAVDQSGSPAEKQALSDAVSGGDETRPFDIPHGGVRLRAALDAAFGLDGRATKGDVATAARKAATYSAAA